MAGNRSIGADLTQGSIVKQMLVFAFPVMLATALQQLYSMVDMIIMGQFVGSAGLSAVSIGSQTVGLLTALGIGFSMGSQVLIAQYVGAQRKNELNKIIGTTFSIMLITAIIVSILSIVLRNQILALLKTPVESYSGAVDYLIICSIGLIFVCGYNMVSATLRGMGDSSHPLLFVAIACAANIVLDLLLVGVLKMDAAGAALATVLSQALSFLWAVRYLYKSKESFGFDFKLKSLLIDPDIFKKLMKLGIPHALQMGAINCSFLFVSANVNQFGVAASAAFGVGQKIEHIPGIASRGLSGAVSAMVGQNFGAGKLDRVKKTTNVALLGAGIVYVVFAILYFIFPQQLFGLFTSDAEVLNLSKVILWSMMLAYPFNILMNTYSGVVGGVGNATLGAVTGILDGIVLRVGLAYLLGTVFNLGLMGFVMGYSLAAMGVAIPSAIYYWTGLWKRHKNLVTGERTEGN